ncbi:MAG: orotidine-5'-phosphate decarboxylase [Betaproteobacteria bacterium]|nr:orotidine-5'-phosphate decarboxylase [Betaproteobacteria bacterium]
MGPRIIVALDFPRTKEAADFVRVLDPKLCRVKVGKELFTAAGPAFVESLAGQGFDVFLDLKFHDIPNTVARACRLAASLGVWMLNVHALGGRTMMLAARESLESIQGRRPLLVAVTVLTSMTGAEMAEVGLGDNVGAAVSRLAALTAQCGLAGVVCSAQEAAGLRAERGTEFLLVTPGIRLAGDGAQDQKRVTTPEQAIAWGASYLVIGRPVTRALDPNKVLIESARGIESAHGA